MRCRLIPLGEQTQLHHWEVKIAQNHCSWLRLLVRDLIEGLGAPSSSLTLARACNNGLPGSPSDPRPLRNVLGRCLWAHSATPRHPSVPEWRDGCNLLPRGIPAPQEDRALGGSVSGGGLRDPPVRSHPTAFQPGSRQEEQAFSQVLSHQALRSGKWCEHCSWEWLGDHLSGSREPVSTTLHPFLSCAEA